MEIRKISINILLALVLLVPTITVAQILHNRSIDMIGTTDPYCGTDGYLQVALGLEADEAKCRSITITNTDITDNVSDWVLLELRAVDKGNEVGSATTRTVVSRKPAFLLTNGHVVDAEEYQAPDTCNGDFAESNISNCPPVVFEFPDNNDILNKDLYVVVRHLNHLDVISNERMSTATTTMGTRYTYDFTPVSGEETNAARGGNLGLKIRNIQNGEMSDMGAMYVGDVNQDANINAADYLQIYHDIDMGITSKESDINFNGTVDANDVNVSSPLGQNLGRTTQLP